MAEQAKVPVDLKVEKSKGLIVKLCEVMAATGWVEKSGTNQKQGYKYATEADVLSTLRMELAKRNVFIFPSIEKTERNLHSKTSGGYDMFITDVLVKWTFLDGDTGETHECLMPGCGTDTGDKGLYKAITGSSKYMFLKAFMLPTGDDPEEEKEDPKVAKANAQAVGAAKVREVAKKMGDESVELVPWKNSTLVLRGNGLAIVRASLKPEEKEHFTFKNDLEARGWTIPESQGNQFASMAEKYQVKCIWIEASL